MSTPSQVIERLNIDLSPDDCLRADIDVPVLTTLQRQGDVAFLPVDRSPSSGMDRVGPEGVRLVVGEATGNTHWLSADPDAVVWFRRNNSTVSGDTLIGEIWVESGAAWATHTDEHSVHGLGPAVYEVRGKRTQREEIERVQD